MFRALWLPILMIGMAATPVAADQSARFLDAFQIGCLTSLDDLDGAQRRLAQAGYTNNGRDSGWTKNEYKAYFGEKQKPDNTSCGGTALNTDPRTVGEPLAARISGMGYKIESAKRSGVRTMIVFSTPQGRLEALAQPGYPRASTRIVVRRVK